MKRKVTEVTETTKLNEEKKLERWITVEYMLDELGPFSFTSLKSAFSWEAVKRDMDTQEQGLKAVSS